MRITVGKGIWGMASILKSKFKNYKTDSMILCVAIFSFAGFEAVHKNYTINISEGFLVICWSLISENYDSD